MAVVTAAATTAAATAAAAAAEGDCEEDDWELCNDDGFVYKRKRRALDNHHLVTAAPFEDPAAGEKLRRNRRRRTIVKLGDKYRREAEQWEHMLALQDEAAVLETLEIGETIDDEEDDHQETSDSIRNQCGPLIEELVMQVETDESFIEHASSLCEMAEVMCEEEEERFKRLLLELPVWKSTPKEIMLCLCRDD